LEIKKTKRGIKMNIFFRMKKEIPLLPSPPFPNYGVFGISGPLSFLKFLRRNSS
jgi:hypothetical protein